MGLGFRNNSRRSKKSPPTKNESQEKPTISMIYEDILCTDTAQTTILSQATIIAENDLKSIFEKGTEEQKTLAIKSKIADVSKILSLVAKIKIWRSIGFIATSVLFFGISILINIHDYGFTTGVFILIGCYHGYKVLDHVNKATWINEAIANLLLLGQEKEMVSPHGHHNHG